MLDQQSVALVPVSSLVQMQGLFVSICITASSDGLGLVDPLLRDQQLLREEALAAQRLTCLLQGAVQSQHVPHSSLPLAEEVKRGLKISAANIAFSDKEDELSVHVIGDVHQDEDGKVPEASTLQLSCVAAVEEALTGSTQVAVMQRLQDPPQVPAQTVVQALPGDGQWLQHLLQAVVSGKQGRKKDESENIFQG